jgi:cytochrome c oxidase subunit IV
MSDTTELEPTGSGETAVVDLQQGDLGYRMSHAAPNLLPGELRAHPDPYQYVIVAVVLAVITGFEIAVSYTEGDLPDGLIVVLLVAMMVVKFAMVAMWFMHLRTDRMVFRRLFILGAIGAPLLFLIVLSMLHGVLAS